MSGEATEDRDLERQAVAIIGLAVAALADGLYRAGLISDQDLRMRALIAAQDEARSILEPR